MADADDDYISVEGKVPRRDRDGNEITSTDLGTGGARRDDGTLAALAYDLRPQPDGGDPGGDRGGLSPEMQQWLRRVGWVVLEEIVIPVAREVAPHVKVRLQARYRGFIERRGAGDADGGEATEPTPPHGKASIGPAEALPESREAPNQTQVAMTAAEWEEGFRAWVAATAIEEALREMLANARIEADGKDLLALQDALRELTPEQRAAIANRMLQANALSLDDDRLATFVKVFGEGRIVEGQFVPLGLEEPGQGLPLADGEMGSDPDSP